MTSGFLEARERAVQLANDNADAFTGQFGETLRRVVLSRRINLLNTAVFALIGALNFLLSPAQADAGVGVGPSVADSLLDKCVMCITAGVMAGTVAYGSLTATNTRRVVIERMAIGAIVRRVDTGLRDDALGRAGALLRIELGRVLINP